MILGIESSCDETALALFDPERGLAGEWLHSQIALHADYGGVVPDLASREHLRQFRSLLERVGEETAWRGLQSIAVTRGPGLAACLAMGLAVGRALSLALAVPVIGVNHLRGHVVSPLIPLHAENPARFAETLRGLFPHAGLLVSGGNTLLFILEADGSLEIVAATRDDAAGEALDKGAKLLGLGYPGGPLIEKRAAGGDAAAFDFPRGLSTRGVRDGDGKLPDFSFSGLKTSLRYRLESLSDAEVAARLPDLCASYQQAVIDALADRVRRLLASGRFASFGLSGGVANNGLLRATLAQVSDRAGVRFLAAERRHTGDNAGMIAFAAWFEGQFFPEKAALRHLDLNPSLDVPIP